MNNLMNDAELDALLGELRQLPPEPELVSDADVRSVSIRRPPLRGMLYGALALVAVSIGISVVWMTLDKGRKATVVVPAGYAGIPEKKRPAVRTRHTQRRTDVLYPKDERAHSFVNPVGTVGTVGTVQDLEVDRIQYLPHGFGHEFSRQQLHRLGIDADTMFVFTPHQQDRILVSRGVANVRGRSHTLGRKKWDDVTRTIIMAPDGIYDIEAVQAYTQYLDQNQHPFGRRDWYFCWADDVRTFDSVWVRKYPVATRVIGRILHEVNLDASTFRDPDMYAINYKGYHLRVRDVLVPVSVVTPWVPEQPTTKSSSVEEPMVRHVMTAWYLPTDRLMASLPDSYRASIEAHYRTVIENLERMP